MNEEIEDITAEDLTMTFDPMTIEHLGVRMYSTLPPVLAELVANAYDADACKVEIILKDDRTEKEIIVKDNGDGMTFDEINTKFLRIGRNRREIDGDLPTQKGRRTIGKKGLGKLAFFGIAHEIEITTKKGGKENSFLMKWEDIKAATQAEYKPVILKKDEACSTDEQGTIIILRDIKRTSNFNTVSIANSLSRIFIFDPDFKVYIKRNNEDELPLNNEMKYADLKKEIEWNIPEDALFESTYSRRAGITGKLITTKKPIPPKTNMRGVTLYSRKKLVNLPEYFSDSTSSHFFSYLTGWLMVDFIDDFDDDVIATNRQSLNWGHPEMKELREYLRSLLNWLETDWRKKRAEIREADLTQKTGINVPNWFAKLPEDIKNLVEPVLQALVKDSELPTETTSSIVSNFHQIVPEYPKYHWRYLHPEVQKISRSYYENQDYYTAFLETAKRYVNAVREKSQITEQLERGVMEQAFKHDDPILSVTENFRKSDGNNFSDQTIKNVKEAQKMFSVGAVVGGRHVIAHEEVVELRTSGLFRDEDCLDGLSLLSHLFYRLDKSKKVR
ncbi:TIGR02391 family protein [Clostridium sp.]|uniref:TIGR02391 family protein n=1 Tax=Clostridium sp. TaxID=1506 RepID=UPI0028442F80|nr:TIGR02391 family protein [Clostridium sp.]MDR3596521.1 TIGR02391 family protein [Clostridium sp.]